MKNVTVIKRDGSIVPFDKKRIEIAITKAMNEVGYEDYEGKAKSIANRILYAACDQISVEKIEELTFNLMVEKGGLDSVIRAYESFRAVQAYRRKENPLDKSIESLIKNINEDLATENSNKDATIISTQRDLFAGEVSKDLTRRKLYPAHMIQAHDEGIYHLHDQDYLVQQMINCCLINIGDMLDNGTVIGKRMIESPRSFRTAATVLSQISAQVASNQFGGQSMNIKHLGKYLKRSYDRYLKMFNDEKIAQRMMVDELEAGVQTIQYQILTISSTNGQSPFITLFMELDESCPYVEYTAMIIEEFLKQRIKGIKNEKGIYTTPTFPKLLYLLDEHNVLKGGKYDYLTKLAIRCNISRMSPDFVSAKIMRKNYEGNVFSSMGCRAWLSPWKDENGNYKFEGRFNQHVVTLNLPQIAALSKADKNVFYKLLDRRLEMCKEALLHRYNMLLGTLSDTSPIHWQHGGIARLKPGETIDHLLKDGYSTLSLGYCGIYETTKLMIGESHTAENGEKFALEVMNYLKNRTLQWKKDTGLGFALYGSPIEGVTKRFVEIDTKHFGLIEDYTSKGYIQNSFHVDVREKIDAFSKLKFEAPFHAISSGGCISYVDIPNMKHNPEALEAVVGYIYEHSQYACINTKADVCQKCDFEGEFSVEDLHWKCPQCGNTDINYMNVVRRTAGYLAENLWNKSKMIEINSRKLHL